MGSEMCIRDRFQGWHEQSSLPRAHRQTDQRLERQAGKEGYGWIQEAPMKTTAYLDTHPGTRPRIFAHRGLTYSGEIQVADENTLESFQLALAAGADYLETDIQVTKDKIPVLFHDTDLKRLVGKKTLIADLTLSELKQIRLPHSGQIPTLAEALTRFPEAKFNLDLKTCLLYTSPSPRDS